METRTILRTIPKLENNEPRPKFTGSYKKSVYLGYFRSYFLLLLFIWLSTFKHKNSLRTIEAEIVQKLKNNEARPKFTGSYKKGVYAKPINQIETAVCSSTLSSVVV